MRILKQMNMLDKSKRIFICPILPENIIRKYNASFAANNFCFNLINGDIFDSIYAYMPTGNIDSKELKYDDNRIKGYCCQSFRNKPLLRRISFVMENWMLFRRINCGDKIWFYNLPYTIILLFILIKVFKPSVNINIIMLDYTPYRKGFRGLYDRFELFCINRFDGIIQLANSDLFKCGNSITLPGVVPMTNNSYPINYIERPEFLISGVLDENISMLSVLIKTFISLPETRLHISGFTADENIIKKICAEHDNIVYHGNLSLYEYKKLLSDIPFLLSTRNPLMPENKCNFPSKIIEGLLYNRIIISTIHYPQLEGINYFEVGFTLDEFLFDVRNIVAKDRSELLPYANQSNIVQEKFSCEVWKKAVSDIENSHHNSRN